MNLGRNGVLSFIHELAGTGKERLVGTFRFGIVVTFSLVLASSYALLGQGAKNVVTIAVIVDPVIHVIHHFALNLRIRVLEIGMVDSL